MICKVQLLDSETGEMTMGELGNEHPGADGALLIIVDGRRADFSRYTVVGAVSNTRSCNDQVDGHLKEREAG